MKLIKFYTYLLHAHKHTHTHMRTHTHLLGFLFLDPEDVRSLSLGAIWMLQYRNGSPMTWTSDYGTQRACPKGVHASGPIGLEPIYYFVLFYSNVVVYLRHGVITCDTTRLLPFR